MKFMSGTEKYTSQDYKTNEDISSELKINPIVKKIQNYIHKWIQQCSANGRRRTATLMKYQTCGKRNQGRPLKRLLDCQCDRKSSRSLKPCKLCDVDEDNNDDDDYDCDKTTSTYSYIHSDV